MKFPWIRTTVLCLLALSLSGCSGLFSVDKLKADVRRLLKPDLHAFLDGDGNGEKELKETKDVIKIEGLDDVGIERVPEVAQVVERCSADVDPKFSYRRRLAVLAFDISNRQDTVDFPRLETQYPELLHDFIDDERFSVKVATQYRLLNKGDERRGAWVESKEAQVMHLADELGVQFLVTGIAEDMSIVDPRLDVLQLVVDKAARRKLAGEVVRHLAISLHIYDGGTGRLIKRQSFADAVAVNHHNLGQRKVLNRKFLNTRYGQLMARALKEQSDFLPPALDCIPMQMKVIAVSERGVTFDAGIESLVLPGDKLQLFRRINLGLESNTNGGYRLERYGALTVSRSHTFSAEATFEQANMLSGVTAGDIVQAW